MAGKRITKPIQEVTDEQIREQDWFITDEMFGTRKIVSKYRLRVVVRDDEGQPFRTDVDSDKQIFRYEEEYGLTKEALAVRNEKREYEEWQEENPGLVE